MKLYYSPGACSMAPHIVLREAGYKFDLEKVDIPNKKTAGGDDFWKVNPKGYVPLLELDDGELLSEGPVIVQYIADRNPASNLAPAAGTMERYRLQEWLNFITSELHKQFGPLFQTTTPAEYKETLKEKIGKRFDWVATQLEGQDYLMGSTFTVADGYLFTMLAWADRMKFDLSGLANLKAYQARVGARPMVQEALTKEGLMKAA